MSEFQPPATPPPGWYPNPSGEPGQRWWDGGQWTDHVQGPDITGLGYQPGKSRDVGSWMSELMQIIRSRAGHIFTISVVMVVPVSLILTVGLWWATADLTIRTESDGQVFFEGIDNRAAAIAGALAFLATMITVVQYAALTRQVVAARHQPEPWSASLVGGLRRLPRLVGVYLQFLVMMVALVGVLVVAFLVASAIGWLAMLVVLGLWIYFGLRLGLVPIAATLAPRGVWSIPTAFRITKDRVLALLGRAFLLGLIAVGIQFAVSILTSPFIGGDAIDPEAVIVTRDELFGTNLALFALAQVLSVLAASFVAAITAGGLALLYEDWGGPVDLGHE